MEFRSFEELELYIKEKAIEKTKFKLKIAHLNKNNENKDNLLNVLYKISLREVRDEILTEYRNGELEILENKDDKTRRL